MLEYFANNLEVICLLVTNLVAYIVKSPIQKKE
jgi:hypothetical protein